MNISAINCTSIKPQQSFGKNNNDSKKSAKNVVSNIAAAAVLGTLGVFATKGVAGQLLTKVKTNNEFANLLGEKLLTFYKFVSKKVSGIEIPDGAETKLKSKAKKFGERILDSVSKYAKKGVDDLKVAEEFKKAPDKKLLQRLSVKLREEVPAYLEDEKAVVEIVEDIKSRDIKTFATVLEGIKKQFPEITDEATILSKAKEEMTKQFPEISDDAEAILARARKELSVTVPEFAIRTEKFQKELAHRYSNVLNATNGTKKSLAWVAGGAAGAEAFRNEDGDDKNNAQELLKNFVNKAEEAVT